MTHSRLTQDYSREQAKQPKELTHRIVLYSLFSKDLATGRWRRVSSSAYTEQLAYRVFGARLATAPLSLTIRPIKIESDKAQGISHFRAVTYNEFRDSPLRDKNSR